MSVCVLVCVATRCGSSLASGLLVGHGLCCLAGNISSALCEMRVCVYGEAQVRGGNAGWLTCAWEQACVGRPERTVCEAVICSACVNSIIFSAVIIGLGCDGAAHPGRSTAGAAWQPVPVEGVIQFLQGLRRERVAEVERFLIWQVLLSFLPDRIWTCPTATFPASI